MWSLGVILLELVIGFPVWMSYKGRIVRGENLSSNIMTGVFGVQGRTPSKIAKIQQNVAGNLAQFLQKQKTELCVGGINMNDLF